MGLELYWGTYLIQLIIFVKSSGNQAEYYSGNSILQDRFAS